jgi:hypothetical protein
MDVLNKVTDLWREEKTRNRLNNPECSSAPTNTRGASDVGSPPGGDGRPGGLREARGGGGVRPAGGGEPGHLTGAHEDVIPDGGLGLKGFATRCTPIVSMCHRRMKGASPRSRWPRDRLGCPEAARSC